MMQGKANMYIPSSICSTHATEEHIQHILTIEREKYRNRTQSYDKSPYTDRKIQKATWQHKNAIKNFDYTTIADRLRTVSWGSDSHRLKGSQPSH